MLQAEQIEELRKNIATIPEPSTKDRRAYFTDVKNQVNKKHFKRVREEKEEEEGAANEAN
jgi:hypothetical protein